MGCGGVGGGRHWKRRLVVVCVGRVPLEVTDFHILSLFDTLLQNTSLSLVTKYFTYFQYCYILLSLSSWSGPCT